MDLSTRVQILDEALYISYTANTLGKSMNPTILPPENSRADKVWPPVLEKEKLWIQTR